MGQYYMAINIDKIHYLYSHDWDNGSKLMEHSWITNNFVEVAERLLSPNGAWYKNRIVWAGDYGIDGLFLPDNAPKTEDNTDYNLYGYAYAHGTNTFPDADAIKKKYPDFKDYHEKKEVLAKATKKWLKSLPKKGRYLVNHTKKVCLDLEAEKGNGDTWGDGKTPVIIHPLPLLTSNGNGQGGGDYSGNHMQLVGEWAGDVISMENNPTYTLNPPVNFREGKASVDSYQFVSDEPQEDKTVVKEETEVLVISEENKDVLDLLS